ncbi:nucleoside phosphorylase [Acinetobacter lwoffii]|uniref:5'-methylthioadenosine/S-adenosylhomocysteine nucleosidase family protein n=1 Tax=Acinetobacter lwoffii TaxID=28090 RepID=UPI00300A0E34
MKILILEDQDIKFEAINSVVKDVDLSIDIIRVKQFSKFLTEINRESYNLIISDLLVPLFEDSRDTSDVTLRIIEECRDYQCKNFRTPIIALTQFDSAAEENFKDLNQKDILVITYNETDDIWKKSLSHKISNTIPEQSYNFIIFCALKKEANAYTDLGYTGGNDEKIISSLKCKEIQIANRNGVIITLPRMGLVSAAITVTKSIEKFKPEIVCMSGICAGIDGKADIYDVIVPNICHQHDSGKWTTSGFIPELYDVPLQHPIEVKIDHIITHRDFTTSIAQGIKLSKSEFPDNKEELEFKVFLAPTSSGSAVVADDEMNRKIMEQHRRKTAFEMESYALYESARVSQVAPAFFSAKSVVDNGTNNKSDNYHRVACLLSAKVVYEIISKWDCYS